MRLQVLLSAMFLEDESYIDTLNITTDAVVINQCDNESCKCVKRPCGNDREQTVTYVDLIEMGEKGRPDKDMILKAGDVVWVPMSWY